MAGNEESVFAHAQELEDARQRSAYLDQACAGNPDLRHNVESLLSAYDAGHFLESPAVALVDTAEESIREHPGTVIGPYTLLEAIGEGGFGVVFLAEQTEPVRRKVALKVLKPGMDTRQVVARFEAERQALALMDHPNIARILDGGATDSGRPYFVMELVRGVPITRYCDEHRLTVRQRLELFVSVCCAVQHAHTKGVIHRDLKPSNVLVARVDDRPVPKVIDFGVAKSVGTPLTEQTLHTGLGALVGTVEYMSPEQATLNQPDIDTRSDVYSLGVLQYELLTGTTPLDRKRLKDSSLLEVLRTIREDEPPRPSARLSAAAALPALAAGRGTEPAKLIRLVRGELDWIVMKSLEKDRSRRYETANGFAQDMQHYLADEPVQACPPSAWYRFRKFMRRNRAPLTVAAAVASALVLSVVTLAVGNVRIAQALGDARVANGNLEAALRRESEVQFALRKTLARRDWVQGDRDQARLHLANCPPELRDPEWQYLHRALSAEVAVLAAQIGGYGRIAFSPDGRRLASIDDRQLTLWDLASTAPVFRAPVPTRFCASLAFSPAGDQIAAVQWFTETKEGKRTNGLEVRAWKLPEGASLGNVTLPEMNWGEVSLDGLRVAGFGPDGRVRIFDTSTGQEVASFRGPEKPGLLALSRNGRWLVANLRDDAIGIWDTHSGKCVRVIEGLKLPYAFLHTQKQWVLSDDGSILALSTQGTLKVRNRLVVCRRSNGSEEVYKVEGEVGTVLYFALSRDGRYLAATHQAPGRDCVVVWDLASRQEVITLRGHTDQLKEIVFSPGGRSLASASVDGTVRVWDLGFLSQEPTTPSSGGPR